MVRTTKKKKSSVT